MFYTSNCVRSLNGPSQSRFASLRPESMGMPHWSESPGAPGHSWSSCAVAGRLCLASAATLWISIALAGSLGADARALIDARMASNGSQFYVYQDGDSAFNHGTPSGFFGVTAKLTIDASCLDDASSGTGCSTDAGRTDRLRGTVLRLTFAPLALGEFVGLNVQEPAGYDLSGASSVSFEFRTPSTPPLMLKFGVGGCMTQNFMRVPAQWTKVTIDLSALSCQPDKTSVGLLFAVVANDASAPQGGTVLINNIRFDSVPAGQASVPSFPLSTQTFGVVPRSTKSSDAPDGSGRPQFPADQVLRNLSTTYESALVGIASARRGTPQGVADARRIADAFSYALHHPNRGLLLPTAPGGAQGLQNGFEAGDLPLHSAQAVAQAGEVRLSGFSLPEGGTICGQGRFCLLLDGATGGNNSFAMLALLAAYAATGERTYLDDARTIGAWIAGLLLDTSSSSYGGYFLGYPDGGQLPKNLIKGKSTENNGDIYHAFSLLSTLVSDPAEAQQWQRLANVAGDFVMSMFDPATGCFNAGTVPIGSSGLGILTNGVVKGTEVINIYSFLDSNTFTVLPMAESPRYRSMIDWRRPVQCIVDHFSKQVTVAGTTYQGMSIAADPLGGPTGIAWEFTGQTVVAMRLVDQLYGESRFEALADQLLLQMRSAQLQDPFGDGKGLVASTLQNGDGLAPLQQCLITPFQCIPERVGLAATTWAVFADENINPFKLVRRPLAPDQLVPILQIFLED